MVSPIPLSPSAAGDNGAAPEQPLSRRGFLRGSAAAGLAAAAAGAVGGVTLGPRAYAGSAEATIPPPPNFPGAIPVYQQTYTNWAQELTFPDVWTCSPRTSADVAVLANWAKDNGYRLRPLGSGHGFAPTILQPGSPTARFVLVNTTDHLTGISVTPGSPGKAACQAGALLEDIAAACEPHGLGFLHTTAPGDVTVAGALAMNCHGTAVPVPGEHLAPGHSTGTLSNLVLSLTAVVWDAGRSAYVLRTFARNDPSIGPLLTHVGRAFVTDVTLQMGPNLKMRCLSRTDIDTDTLFAQPGIWQSNTFAEMVRHHGSVEVIWFPFHKTPWMKLWTKAPTQPASSKAVTGPYNYPFSDNTPLEEALATAAFLRQNPAAVPDFNTRAAEGAVQALAATTSGDLWGSAHALTFYVKPTSLRVTTAAWGVLTPRVNIQRVVADFYHHFNGVVAAHQAQGQFPYTGPVELRAHGLDRPGEVVVPGAVPPYLSGARPIPYRPDLDTILWFAVNNNVNQPGAIAFNQQIENWFLTHFGPMAVVRPEWTKTYGYTAAGGWTNGQLLTRTFPDTFRGQGYSTTNNWDAAVGRLNAYDPHRVFTNQYLDTLMPA
ncbi:cholesterol oxidase substrate-binding domain-containing protein [Yinghuangia sp. YIM S09857]|uniref:cholesterol oxidase substrate-binding domain-containing protein n=1 Tax=Yinghuangia sp. YIM S09857 TaxID=3436929 RepID=UPI003F53C0FA